MGHNPPRLRAYKSEKASRMSFRAGKGKPVRLTTIDNLHVGDSLTRFGVPLPTCSKLPYMDTYSSYKMFYNGSLYA